MKKILAFALAIVMTFSMTVLPAGASLEDSIQDAENIYTDTSNDISDVVDSAKDVYDSLINEDYGSAVSGVFVFMEKLFDAIHSLVHTLSEIFDFDCPFCDGKYSDDDDADADEPTTEETTTEETTTEETTTEETTTEETTTEETTTEETTTEETTTEETTTEETTTEETTTEETTTEETTTEETTTEETTTEEPITEAPEVTYESYYVQVKNSTLASDRYYNYTIDGPYPMNVDVAYYFWNRGYKANTVTIKNMATAYVNAAVYISEESVGIDTIVFAGGNNFHGNNGVFKLIVNTTEIPVKVKLSGTNKIGSLVLTAANIGDYIVGPYTVV